MIIDFQLSVKEIHFKVNNISSIIYTKGFINV